MSGDLTVFVPIGMRPLTGGLRTVSASGATISQVIDDLESRYPGFHMSLIEEGQLKPSLTIAVNSVEQPLGLLARVPEGAEIHIIQALAGGKCYRATIRIAIANILFATGN